MKQFDNSDDREPLFAPAGKLVEAKGLGLKNIFALLDCLREQYRQEDQELIMETRLHPGSDSGAQIKVRRDALRRQFARVGAYLETYYSKSLLEYNGRRHFNDDQEYSGMESSAKTIPTSGY